jgi:SAM-dependent methyltransferase
VSLPPNYFDDLYASTPDPWGFHDRPYEARKRALTLAALPDEHYASVFEAGCSIGVLTTELAKRCDRLLAMDVSGRALEIAKSQVPQHVELIKGSVPRDWPDERVHLAVLSEVGYYLDEAGCRALAFRAVQGADVIAAVHWRHHVADYPINGDTVHALLAQEAVAVGWSRLVEHVEEDFLLDIWSADPRSVARRTGLL